MPADEVGEMTRTTPPDPLGKTVTRSRRRRRHDADRDAAASMLGSTESILMATKATFMWRRGTVVLTSQRLLFLANQELVKEIQLTSQLQARPTLIGGGAFGTMVVAGPFGVVEYNTLRPQDCTALAERLNMAVGVAQSTPTPLPSPSSGAGPSQSGVRPAASRTSGGLIADVTTPWVALLGLAGVLLIVGALLPWVTVSAGPFQLSRAGIGGSEDGWWILGIGVGLIIAAIRMATISPRSTVAQRVATSASIGAAIAVITTIHDSASVSAKSSDLNSEALLGTAGVHASVGSGLVLAVVAAIGSAVALVGWWWARRDAT